MSASASGSNSRRNSTRRVVAESDDEDEGVKRKSGEDSDGMEVTPSKSSVDSRKLSNARVASSSTSRTRAIDVDGDEDGEENDENDASRVETPSASASSKRRRLSKSGRASAAASQAEVDDAEEEDEEEATPPPPSASERRGKAKETRSPLNAADEDEEEQAKKAVKQQRLIRDHKDGYVMGSIVRIKCKNFLTYTNAECKPGAGLNMLIGPNGSGKSTIAAAIAIGLGYPAKVMGRSRALKNFVREKSEEGSVEIELKGRPGRPNLTVKRSINAQNDQSVFEINGKASTKDAVTEAIQQLNVNVNNLCSFLPQDRVKEFAALSGFELLKETQRVIDPRLLIRQEQLIKLKDKYTKAAKSLEGNEDSLADNEKKLNSMEKDVKRHKEKQNLEDQVLLLEVCVPYSQYAEAKEKHDNLKREKNKAKERVDALNDQNAPLVTQRDSIALLQKNAEKRFRAISAKYLEVNREHTSVEGSCSKAETSVEKLRTELGELKAAETKRKLDLSESERTIQSLSKKLADEPPEGEPEELKERLRDLTTKMRAKQAEIMESAASHEVVNREIDAAASDRGRVKQNLASLNDVYKRRDEQCMREDRELWAATSWLRQNKERMEGTVCEPIRLLVSVKDKRYAKVAEAAINYNTFKTILCHEEADYRKLSAQFTKFPAQDGRFRDLRMNLARFPPEKRNRAAYPPPCSPEELRAYGFDAFAIDLIDGPEEVLAYLCDDQNLHRIPVAFDDGRNIQHERLAQPNSPFRRYITRNAITNINFSKYGDRKAVVQDNQTRDARIFAETIDQNRRQDLEMRLAQIEGGLKDLQARRDAIQGSDDGLRTEFEEMKEVRKQIDRERKDIANLRQAWEKLRIDIRTARHKHQTLLNVPSEDARRQRLVREMAQLATQRLRTARKLTTIADNMMKCQSAHARVTCVSLQAGADYVAIDKAVNEVSEEMTAARELFDEFNTRFAAAKATAKAIWAKAEEVKERIPDRLSGEFQEQINMGRSSDDVTALLSDMQSELDMCANVSPSIVRKYEETKKTVDQLRKVVAEQKETTESSGRKMDGLRRAWEGPLNEIIETITGNFSSAMNSLGLLGEIQLSKDEADYSKWAIKILVSFRDKEEVSELTAQRQSGGERSLTTMVYLVSLLELSQVPFSMVDEINQGMDGRAERAIHDILVHAVCEKANQGQFFLLTPKLLTGLSYHENMKVLCVNNGDWIPEKLPLGRILARKLAEVRGNQ